jgi:hypothetical protein
MHDRQSLGHFLTTEHIRELQDDADRERLVRELGSERTRATWRQQTGNVARRLSVVLDDLAGQLDPGPCRQSFGRD